MATPTKLQKSKTQNYPILQPFRLNGEWVSPDYENNKTVPLLPAQASMLLLNGKVGKPGTQAKATVAQKAAETTAKQEGK
ncbi:hypothetical protein [Vibrio anguillarum]|uniref:hypothetical protein n=1 Tax=Vibrio anguillarum TaxID=55601 RepID=UPI00097E3B28|nr:hypothetical protein [Vibrio anguillarum]QCW19931.1 hypothetical protein [Vibrio phage Va_PF430-3_p42]AQM21492.1 hypothetical protein PN51_16975 [Vibrio anguillarum]AUB86139.1 hypothetical protein CKY00_02165 [Vibrio anguillarum]AUB89577.1 hypothetical protein CKX99_02165 [Vibrio anguillarum]AUB93019.1 hypothetical protein CK210_02165 [Vibrio anguillarum]